VQGGKKQEILLAHVEWGRRDNQKHFQGQESKKQKQYIEMKENRRERKPKPVRNRERRRDNT